LRFSGEFLASGRSTSTYDIPCTFPEFESSGKKEIKLKNKNPDYQAKSKKSLETRRNIF